MKNIEKNVFQEKNDTEISETDSERFEFNEILKKIRNDKEKEKEVNSLNI